TKRKTQGYRYTLPAGAAWDRVHRWRDGGASLDDIATITGLEESVTSRILNGPRSMPIYARTFHAIMRAPAGMPLTSIGATRRIQALQRLGWPVERIAIEAGVHRDTILDGRRPRVFIARRVRVSIDEAYRRLHMVIPTGETKQHRAGITRSRNHAERMGWLPPMAWDDIDDAMEHPEMGRDPKLYRSEDLLAEWSFLRSAGVSIHTAASQLGVSVAAIEKATERAGRSVA
ncbi:MAG TPA: hypothetical protein VD864_12100, partial [Nocardioides sp.]|nr:hypothetical protein [Nocardioides sp.]